MKLVWHDAAKEFVDTVEQDLPDGLASHSLVIGLAMRRASQENNSTPPALLLTHHEEGHLLGVAFMTPPRKLLVHAEPEAASLLAHEIHRRGWAVPGLHANVPAAEFFAAAWSDLTGQDHHLGVAERLYVLSAVRSPDYSLGCCRQALPEDAEQLVAWQLDFQRAALPEDPVAEADVRNAIAVEIEGGDRHVWDHDGLVSTAVRCRPTPTGAGITGVYTPPEFRGRGYATSCVARLSQMILDSGNSYAYLFTDLSNPTSNSIYQKIGYRPVCDFQNYAFAGEQ